MFRGVSDGCSADATISCGVNGGATIARISVDAGAPVDGGAPLRSSGADDDGCCNVNGGVATTTAVVDDGGSSSTGGPVSNVNGDATATATVVDDGGNSTTGEPGWDLLSDVAGSCGPGGMDGLISSYNRKSALSSANGLRAAEAASYFHAVPRL